MKEENREILFDLLTKKAIYGLDESEQARLDNMGGPEAELEFRSLEITAAAINMAGLSSEEPLPESLFSKIAADAEQYFGATENKADSPWPPATSPVFTSSDIFSDSPRRSWSGWLGWAAAAAACIALVVNLWVTRVQPPETAKNLPPTDVPKVMTPAELRESMMKSTAGLIKADWAAGNVKDITQLSGDVIWSDDKQAGYMRFKGLPVNDPAKETYQLWIFDKTQDKATPIDGGTFDVNSEGEVVIPINAKLKASGPEMFAITVEKPGGVVVSKREKLAAIAKVETHSS